MPIYVCSICALPIPDRATHVVCTVGGEHYHRQHNGQPSTCPYHARARMRVVAGPWLPRSMRPALVGRFAAAGTGLSAQASRPLVVTLLALVYFLGAGTSALIPILFVRNLLQALVASGLNVFLVTTHWDAVVIGLALSSLPPVILGSVGWGLWRTRNWARWITILISIILLFAYPVGTVVGGLIIVYLFLSKSFH
jgi:hypothetical protein